MGDYDGPPSRGGDSARGGSRGGSQGGLQDEPASASMELEHAIGFTGNLRNCLQFHPNGRDIVYAAGGCVVVADLSDPHNQVFLRGHDDFITSISVSPSGRFIASGQRGDNADVIVWDFEEKRLLYRMQSHDHGIACVSFSHDEKLLLSVGVTADNRLFVWDMATGLLNAQAQGVQNSDQQDTMCAVWGGFFKDIKRRDTSNYMFATGGKKMLRLWALDPMTGSWPVMGEPLTAHGHIRDYTCLRFSEDRNWLYAGSTSGDMTSFQIKSRSLAMCKQCTQGGVESMLLLPGPPGTESTTVFVGGGDGSITKLIAKEHKDLHDVMNGKTYLTGKITSINVAPDGTEVVIGCSLCYMWRMRLSDMKNVKISEAHHGAITSVTFPRDSSDRFATCSVDGTVVMWDLSDYTGVSCAPPPPRLHLCPVTRQAVLQQHGPARRVMPARAPCLCHSPRREAADPSPVPPLPISHLPIYHHWPAQCYARVHSETAACQPASTLRSSAS